MIPEDLLDSLRGCPQFLELSALRYDGAYSCCSEFRDVNKTKRQSTTEERPQEIVVPWSDVPDSLKQSLSAFIGCDVGSLRSISFMVFQRARGIGSHCDQGWVGDSFWGFSIVVKSEPSTAEPYRLLFSTNRNDKVVGEHVVEGNSAYHCCGNNRYYFKHGVAPSDSVGRRFFVRVGLNRFCKSKLAWQQLVQ